MLSVKDLEWCCCCRSGDLNVAMPLFMYSSTCTAGSQGLRLSMDVWQSVSHGHKLTQNLKLMTSFDGHLWLVMDNGGQFYVVADLE